MPAQEITNYINEARKSGLSDQEIRSNLLRTGWPEKEVDDAFGIPVTPTVPGGGSVESRTLMSVLAYIGILVLVPYFSGDAKKDEFVKFHTQQGMVLLVIEITLFVLAAIVSRVVPMLSIFGVLIGVGLLILSVLGVVNATKGEKKELPLVGAFGKKFKI
jgi:uncharacterized membrane protein